MDLALFDLDDTDLRTETYTVYNSHLQHKPVTLLRRQVGLVGYTMLK